MKCKLSDFLVYKIKEWFEANGRDTAVIGISGGKDSTVVAALCARALGLEHVVGVLMPNGEQTDINDSREVVQLLGIPYIEMNILDSVMGTLKDFQYADGPAKVSVSEGARINIPAITRMMHLYAVAQSVPGHAAVVGTGNAAEVYVGYFTKFGDGACDFAPIKELWVHEVLEVGRELKLPEHLLVKPPADGLSGKTDEERLGFSYDEVFQVASGKGLADQEKAEKIRVMHQRALHKLRSIPTISLTGVEN